jgi:hypothetical protein
LIAGAVPCITPFVPNLFLDKNEGTIIDSGSVEPAGLQKGLPVPFQGSIGISEKAEKKK